MESILNLPQAEHFIRSATENHARISGQEKGCLLYTSQGVGIGLYLAREIVTRQGGYIKVVSEPGKGSEFSIMLPTK